MKIYFCIKLCLCIDIVFIIKFLTIYTICRLKYVKILTNLIKFNKYSFENKK